MAKYVVCILLQYQCLVLTVYILRLYRAHNKIMCFQTSEIVKLSWNWLSCKSGNVNFKVNKIQLCKVIL
jgi:hypothetical protein